MGQFILLHHYTYIKTIKSSYIIIAVFYCNCTCMVTVRICVDPFIFVYFYSPCLRTQHLTYQDKICRYLIHNDLNLAYKKCHTIFM